MCIDCGTAPRVLQAAGKIGSASVLNVSRRSETHRKAASFFLQAAKWAGIPLSPLLMQKGSLAGTRRKRVPIGTNGSRVKPPAFTPGKLTAEQMVPLGGGSYKQIVLSDGSKLFLKTEKDLFQMTTEDRKFSMSLLEQIEAYEAKHSEYVPEMDDEEEED